MFEHLSGDGIAPMRSIRRSKSSAVALLRLAPFLFPSVFVYAAITLSTSVLYVAVALHLLLIVGENTIGRSLAHIWIAPLFPRSTLFEDACVFLWPAFHLVALAAALHLISHIQLTVQQRFAVGAIFAYSINVFSATVGHELLHRNSAIARLMADILFVAMLYPHFPAIHLASHHRWAGSRRDCQTPRPGQQIYGYLLRAVAGGVRMIPLAKALDHHLSYRIVVAVFIQQYLRFRAHGRLQRF